MPASHAGGHPAALLPYRALTRRRAGTPYIPPMVQSPRALGAVLACALTAFVAAQSADAPPPALTPLLVRDAQSGLSVPGVVLRIGASGTEPHLVDGWLMRRGERPRPVATLRSDPDGRVLWTVAQSRQHFTVAPEHRVVSDGMDGPNRVLVVERQPHHVVQVVDGAGRPLADFAVSARHLGMTERTDCFGMVTFPVPDALRGVRGMPVAFAPAQWIGAPDSMPLAAPVDGSRAVRLQVPEHVVVRVRLLKNGVPAAVALDAAWLTMPIEHDLCGHHGPQPQPFELPPVTCLGIEAGPVAWTGAVRGVLAIGRLRVPFASAVFPGDGGVLAIDVETDPPRPRLRVEVRTADGLALRRVRIGARTDAGTFHDEVPLDARGELLASFDAAWLRGTVLQRVWIDALEPAGYAGTAAIADLPVHDGEIALGDVTLLAHEPVLRGRVVDERGVPLPGATVTLRAANAASEPWPIGAPTDAEGRFVHAGPRVRDASGEPVAVVAEASVPPAPRGRRPITEAPFVSAPSAPTPDGGSVELVVADRTTGAFALVVRGVPPPYAAAMQVRVGEGGLSVHERDVATNQEPRAWQRGSYELPRGRTRVRLMNMNELVHELELEIQATRPSAPDAVQVHTLDFAAIARMRSVRAVDAQGQWLADARVYVRTNGHHSGAMPDQAGDLVWLEPIGMRHAAYLVAHGKQVIQLDASAHGAVTMVPAVPVPLRVRTHDGAVLEGPWTLTLEPCDENGLVVHGMLAADGTAAFPGPVAGRYHVAIFHRFNHYERRVRIGTGTLVDGAFTPAEFVLDAAQCAALRALQQEPPPKK